MQGSTYLQASCSDKAYIHVGTTVVHVYYMVFTHSLVVVGDDVMSWRDVIRHHHQTVDEIHIIYYCQPLISFFE